MLRKLLKYELKATGRQFLPLYGALVVFALINNLLFHLGGIYGPSVFDEINGSPELPIAIGVMVYFALIVAIFVLTFVVMIQRFYKNLLSDEGYLMFTLPVKTWQLIASKLLASLLWLVASVAVTILTLFIMAFSLEILRYIPELFHDAVLYIVRYVGVSEVAFFVETLLAFLFSAAEGILTIYAAISLGHLLPRHRVLGAFGAFLGISVVEQIVNKLFGTLGWQIGIYGNDTFWRYNTGIHVGMLATIVGLLIWSAVFFAITNYVLTHKLNIE